ncbi:RNA ligase (ATP) [Lyngbya sp. PCC 8106]|uniref:RNA ligase (ATP) n=1 Tax=Lyngbya sp. (strain PCC 8106) TaxID=313612 RepID=UPI0000EAB5F9|nr:RNA ligase (ATP) [Lyngbya sp. PCC 8106]EAW36014.1 hypothetical protein L8106_22501 [Lyngbya sp. PCC 8106]
MADRKLATIQKIVDIKPILNADTIEVAKIKNWNVVTKKGEYLVGDLCIYCEIDSFLPIKDEFEFLRKSSYKKLPDGSEGFRLRTVKLRGQVSQGLVLPTSILDSSDSLEIGKDVTDCLGIKKYAPPIPANLAGKVKGQYPSFIPKTGGDRIQNLVEDYDQIKEQDFYVTEKLEGCSVTYYYRDGKFGVCSRNLDLLEDENNILWQIARKSKVEEKIKPLDQNIAIQGELIGPGIQGNIYKLNEHQFKVFSIYSIDEARYFNFNELNSILYKTELDRSLKPIETVPLLEGIYQL